MAGEVKVMPGRVIEYNLASGTYMPAVLKPSRGEFSVNTHMLALYMNNKWEAAGVPKANIIFKNDLESFIGRNINNSNLEPYRRAGFRLSEPFDTREKCYTDYFIGQALSGLPGPSPLVFNPLSVAAAAPKGGFKQTKKRRRNRHKRSRRQRR